MPYQLKWRSQASKDLIGIARYIAQDSPKRALSFTAEIRNRIEALAHHPTLYRTGRYPGTREMVVHPNYVVVYQIDGELIRILRVLHSAQRWP